MTVYAGVRQKASRAVHPNPPQAFKLFSDVGYSGSNHSKGKKTQET